VGKVDGVVAFGELKRPTEKSRLSSNTHRYCKSTSLNFYVFVWLPLIFPALLSSFVHRIMENT
jgi:hypothetical protein